jgi:molybdopterin molybdotransferase
MLKVEEALKIILDNIKILSAEEVNILDSLDRVLAEDIYSEIDIPAFDNSAMDGYAVRSLDTDGASFDSPKILEVIEDIPAGCVPKKRGNSRFCIKNYDRSTNPRRCRRGDNG